MSNTSQWRIALAEKIASIYARNPNVAAITLIGGVARGRGDHYSDIDMSLWWHRDPHATEREEAVAQFDSVLGLPVHDVRHEVIAIKDETYVAPFYEDVCYIGGNSQNGFKIDINHRSVAAMEVILDDVLVRHVSHDYKLETCYSIQYVHVLHGHDWIAKWQARVKNYPDALAEKLVQDALAHLSNDVAMHIYRGDLLYVYRAYTETIWQLLSALMALNHLYQPELKRLTYLTDEMRLKPDYLPERIAMILRDDPEKASCELDRLADEVFALVKTHMPAVDVDRVKQAFYTRRQSYENPPEGLAV